MLNHIFYGFGHKHIYDHDDLVVLFAAGNEGLYGELGPAQRVAPCTC